MDKKKAIQPHAALSPPGRLAKNLRRRGIGKNGTDTPANESYDPAQERWSKHAAMITRGIIMPSVSKTANSTPSPAASTAITIAASC